MLLRDIHSKLLTQYDCKEEVCAQSQSQFNVGDGVGLGSQSQAHIGAGPSPVHAGDGVRLNSQDGVPQQQETATLKLPQLNRLIEASFVRDESSASNADVTAIPSRLRLLNRSCFIGSPSETSNSCLRACTGRNN